MKRSLNLWLTAISLCLFSLSSVAKIVATPTPPDLGTKAYILVDYHSDAVLAEKNAYEKVQPASLTKMMTAYVVDHELKNGHISMEDPVHISEKAWRTKGSRMFVEVGKKVTVEDLLRGVIIQSGNDASVALAEYVAGNEEAFAEVMNQYAQNLGMKDSHFVNATGMPHKDHYTTAKDLSILSRAVIRDFPETYSMYSEKWFKYNGIKQPNRNRLLWREPYIDGIKTGHSDSAGFCLAASGEKEGMRLIAVVLGSENDNDRTEYTQQLLRFGFRFFETHHLFQANTTINQPRVWMGKTSKVALGIKEDLFITIPQGQYKNLDAKMNIEKQITAPIFKGERRGKVVVKLGDELIAEKELVTLEEIKEGSFWNRFSDYVSMGFHKLLKSEESS